MNDIDLFTNGEISIDQNNIQLKSDNLKNKMIRKISSTLTQAIDQSPDNFNV